MKKGLVAIGLLLLFSLCLFLPGRLDAWQEEQMLGAVVLENMEAVPVVEKRELGIPEKIGLLLDYQDGSGEVIRTEREIAENTQIEPAEIYEVCMEELGQLAELGILPELPLDLNEEEQEESHSMVMYMSTKDSSSYVIVWEVDLALPIGNLHVMLDDSSHKILSLQLQMEILPIFDIQGNDEWFISKLELHESMDFKAFGKYLGMDYSILLSDTQESGFVAAYAYGEGADSVVYSGYQVRNDYYTDLLHLSIGPLQAGSLEEIGEQYGVGMDELPADGLTEIVEQQAETKVIAE